MNGRKRPARHDPSDPMHWNKEQYIFDLFVVLESPFHFVPYLAQ
jgi:hypothetical protein